MIINVSYFLNTCNSQNFNFQKKIHGVARNFFRPKVTSKPSVSNFYLLNIVPGEGLQSDTISGSRAQPYLLVLCAKRRISKHQCYTMWCDVSLDQATIYRTRDEQSNHYNTEAVRRHNTIDMLS
jgi:hypothetical protein